jgi:hypothetical protein
MMVKLDGWNCKWDLNHALDIPRCWSLKEHFQLGPKVSQSQQGSAQHLSFYFVLLFALPYFTRVKFLLLPALISVFLITFWSLKTCYKSFAIPIAYTGYDGCPSHHRFVHAKLIFHKISPKNINLFPLHDLPGILTLLSLLLDFSCRCFFFFIFSSPRNL